MPDTPATPLLVVSEDQDRGPTALEPPADSGRRDHGCERFLTEQDGGFARADLDVVGVPYTQRADLGPRLRLAKAQAARRRASARFGVGAPGHDPYARATPVV